MVVVAIVDAFDIVVGSSWIIIDFINNYKFTCGWKSINLEPYFGATTSATLEAIEWLNFIRILTLFDYNF